MAETSEKSILRVIKSVSCAALLSRYRSKEFEFSDKALLILLGEDFSASQTAGANNNNNNNNKSLFHKINTH